MSARRSLGADFWKLWAASVISNLGDGLSLIAGPLLAAALTRDPLLISGMAVAQRLPWLLFALFSGAVVDRLDRRRVMVLVDVFRAVVIGALGILVLFDRASLPLLYGLFFLLGTAETLFDSASVSILPSVVAAEELPRANARLSGAHIIAGQFVAPSLGGLLFAASTPLPFLVDAASFGAAALLVFMMRGRFTAERPNRQDRTTLLTEVVVGLAWLFRHGLLRTLALTIGIMNLTFSAAFAVWVLLVQERLGLGPLGYGMLTTCMAVGGVAASVTSDRVIARLGAARVLLLGLFLEAGTHIVIALATEVWVVGAILVLFGFHGVAWGAVSTSLRQELIPPSLLGRVNSAYLLFSTGSVALGSLLGGLIARAYGVTAPFWFAGVSVAVLALVVWPVLRPEAIVRARQAAGGAPGTDVWH